jgi:hypothetical protein
MTIWARFDKDGLESYGVVENRQVARIEGIPFGAHRVTYGVLKNPSTQV